MKRMEWVSKRVFLRGIICALAAFTTTCHGAPSFNPKPSWREENELSAVLASSCNPATGRCWGWLPVVDSRLDDYAIEQDSEYERTQPIHVRDVEQATDSWRDDAEATDLLPVASAGAQVAGKLAKKDVFMSRGWGAGGMPFSVLYMSPRNNHPPAAGKTSAQVDGSKGVDSTRRNGENASPTNGRTNQSNYRVALRNGGFGQPRRHYSIIPQLFISYGWGPSGK